VKDEQRQRLGDLTAGMTVADVVDSDIPSVPGALTLDTLLTQDARERGSAGVYTILDGDRVAGILETASLRRSIWGRQGERRVAEVASPLAEVHGLPPGAPLIRAVEQFEAERTDVVVVVEPVQPPRLVGVIRRAAVLERLSARQALADGRNRAAPDGPGG
jgi:CBS domain-containing protein